MVTMPAADVIFFEDAVESTSRSPKAQRRNARKAERTEKQMRRSPKPVQPRNQNQADYIESLQNNELTFGIGPAGVGKTYLPARVYGHWLASGYIEKLYLARPNVARAKHRNGFLPGTLEEKTAPWLVPIFEGLKEAMSPFEFESFRRDKKIEEVPFEYMQGRTFKNAACIVDEAENLDLDDLYITLTRQGENLNMVLCGDIFQARISNSGLGTVVRMAEDYDMDGVGVVEFNEDDVVRSAQARQWVKAFKRHNYLHSVMECDRDDVANNSDLPSFIRGVA